MATKRRHFSLLMLVMLAAFLVGCGAEQAVKKGDNFFALGEYFDAAAQYKKAYAQTPAKERALRGQRALKMADSYRRINYTQRAIAAYRNAIRYNQGDSLTHLYLGQMLLKNGQYKEAALTLQTALDSMGQHPSLQSRMALARSGLISAENAARWKQEGSRYTVRRQELFNSRRSEFSPMLSGDNFDVIYFSSTRNQAQGDEVSGITGIKNADIFFAQKDEQGRWGKPQTIDTELNTDQDEGACSFSPDGRTMYLTICRPDPTYPRFAQIATSARTDAAWSKAQVLSITRDTLSCFAHPAVSPDGEWLYFVSDMPGGLGGLDIWRARLVGGSVGEVENLGEPINTPGDEMFPTFRPNGDLYFSSTGHPGMGGLDIYIATTRQLPGQEPMVEIEHPGYPLNSMGDDFGMTFEGPHNRGYFSSNRGDARGWDHIYSFEKPEIVQTVKGWVYEQEGYELTEAQVYMVGNDGTNLRLGVKGDGSFTQEVQPGVSYVMLATCKGYLNHKEEIHVDTVAESEEYVLQFPLASISAPVLIRNIFYDFDKATLRQPESTEALDSLVDLLNENPNITIELSAHTDSRGSDAYNQRLSQRRAESVVSYLIDHGIAADRLTPVGYGESRPKTVKRRLTESYTWLKEGDVLTEEFINSLPDEEQREICHQLNRRTEFSVLRTTYGLFDEHGNLKQLPQPKPQPVQAAPPQQDDFLW